MLKLDPDKFYSRRDVASLGFRSYATLCTDAVNRVGIPMHKFGRKAMYKGSDIIAYIEAARVNHAA